MVRGVARQGDKRREQRSYGRVQVRLTVRCRVVGVRLAVSLSACQPTHVGTAAVSLVWIHTDCSRCSHTQPHRRALFQPRRVLLPLPFAYTPNVARSRCIDRGDSVQSAAHTGTSLVAGTRTSIRFNERPSKIPRAVLSPLKARPPIPDASGEIALRLVDRSSSSIRATRIKNVPDEKRFRERNVELVSALR